jgi:hypothetical protein
MRPLLERAARDGRSRVAAIGWAQEFCHVWEARKRVTDPSRPPQFSYAMAERRVTCYYFYLWDEDSGPGFIKVCAYFPYPVKVWLNGHEWAKRQLARAGTAFTELSNGFASCQDPAVLQDTCDRLGPGAITVFFDRWMSRLPLPLTGADRAAGYWWELSLRQVEVSRTIVFDAPRQARAFFRPGPVRSTPGCCTLKKPARDASSIVQPLRGYRSPPSPGTAGGPQDYGSATLECRPWPAPWLTRCAPSPASPTRACAP